MGVGLGSCKCCSLVSRVTGLSSLTCGILLVSACACCILATVNAELAPGVSFCLQLWNLLIAYELIKKTIASIAVTTDSDGINDLLAGRGLSTPVVRLLAFILTPILNSAIVAEALGLQPSPLYRFMTIFPSMMMPEAIFSLIEMTSWFRLINKLVLRTVRSLKKARCIK